MRSVLLSLILVMLSLVPASLSAAHLRIVVDDLLTNFRPAAVKSPNGKVSTVEFTSDIVLVKPGELAYCAEGSMKNFRFAEPVWVIAYKTEIAEEGARQAHENFLCHTFFGDSMPMDGSDEVMRSLYSDAFTREIRMPEGFGVPLGAGDDLHWMPMFNNRGTSAVRVSMKYQLTLIRQKDVTKSLVPLYSTIRSVRTPNLFFVPPGRHEQESTFEFPSEGRIHFLGTHIHPYGTSIELYDLARNQAIWKGTRTKGDHSDMGVYSSGQGYSLHAGQRLRLTSTYDNPTDHWIDAMAGLFIFFSKE